MKWKTTVRGRNLVKRQMTPEERKKYGPPLTGRDAAVAEMQAINEERMLRLGWEDEDLTNE